MSEMIKEDDFVSMTKNGVEWFGYVVRFVEPNYRGIKVQWHPEFSSWHNYDELTRTDFPSKPKINQKEEQMSEINGIPKTLWDDVQFMLQETLDEYVPDFITQAVALYVIRAKEEAVSKAIANRTIAHRDAASNDTGFEHGRNHP